MQAPIWIFFEPYGVRVCERSNGCSVPASWFGRSLCWRVVGCLVWPRVLRYMVYTRVLGYLGRRFRLLRVVLGGRLLLRRSFGTNGT